MPNTYNPGLGFTFTNRQVRETHQRDCQRDVPRDVWDNVVGHTGPQFKQHCHKRRVGRRAGRRAGNYVGVFRAQVELCLKYQESTNRRR